MKKIFNLMLIFILTIMVLIPGVSAVTNYDNTNTDGKITINGAIDGKTYSIYQILVLDSYDSTVGGYIYKVTNDNWADFITSGDIDGVYVNVDDENYVTWIKAETEEANNRKVAEFAKLALAYVKRVNSDSDNDNNITATATETATAPTGQNTTTIEFDDLKLGYYLVDSTVGILCGLRTTANEVTINEKNSVPTVTKEVKENNTFGESNSAYIGETVYFKTTVKIGKGAENYVLYDTMSKGLTFNQTSLTVKLDGADLVKDTDYTVSFTESTYTFVITFANNYVETLAENKEIIVEYTAVVNAEAEVGTNGNNNTATLKYGDNTDTNYDTDVTKTYTYGFDLVKINPSKEVITGAEFDLYEVKNGVSRKIYLVYDSVKGVYRVLHTGNDNNGVKIQAGKVRIEGLDNGNYYLKETKAPEGYTKLLGQTDFEIDGANLTATMKQDGTYDAGGIFVENTKGNLLPQTGGIGTTLFIVIGSLMVTLFGLLLVTKYRMSKIDN